MRPEGETIALAKSLAPYLVALLLRVLGQYLNELQWVCVLLQPTSRGGPAKRGIRRCGAVGGGRGSDLGRWHLGGSNPGGLGLRGRPYL
mgnify:CR=1 FL=1